MKKISKISGGLSIFAVSCCFGLLNLVFGFLGLVSIVGILNNYGDYLFFPLFSASTVIFLWTVQKSKLLLRGASIVAAVVTIFFLTFGAQYFALISLGVFLGGGFIQWKLR